MKLEQRRRSALLYPATLCMTAQSKNALSGQRDGGDGDYFALSAQFPICASLLPVNAYCFCRPSLHCEFLCDCTK